jgi:hypothetical protein
MSKLIIESGASGRSSARLAIVLVSALVLGAAFLAATIFLGSCAAKIDGSLAPDGGARIQLSAEIPAAVATRLRRLSQANPQSSTQSAPLFSSSAVRRSIAARQGISLHALSTPSPDSIRADMTIRSLEELAYSDELKNSGLLVLARGNGWKELRVRLERGNMKALASLFPGIDPYLLAAISPPAFEEEPVTAEEYRQMLAAVLGEKSMPALEAAAAVISLTAPTQILESEGGTVSGTTFTARIPILDALVLEKPIVFRLRWKTP